MQNDKVIQNQCNGDLSDHHYVPILSETAACGL